MKDREPDIMAAGEQMMDEAGEPGEQITDEAQAMANLELDIMAALEMDSSSQLTSVADDTSSSTQISETTPGRVSLSVASHGNAAGKPPCGQRFPTAPVEKICAGCLRILGISLCFFDHTKTVAWPYKNGDGIWCNDCFVNWRTCFSQSQPLSLLKQWITSNARNKEVWTLHLLASLMIRYEDKVQQIRLSLVEARIPSIKFLCRLLNVPLCPHVVVRFADLSSSCWSSRRADVKAENLLMLGDGNGSTELGVWMPVTDSDPSHPKQHGGTLLDRGALGCPSLRPHLWTTRSEDLACLQEFGFNTPDSAVPAEQAEAIVEAEDGDTSKIATKKQRSDRQMQEGIG